MEQPLYQRYNTDSVFNRSVIAGLLYLLNHKITYEQTWQDNVTENVTVPFAYNFAHAKDQRFAQDNYTFFGRECFSDKFIDGKFDMLPRFAVTYTGSGIDAQNITNRFIKAKHQVVKDGKIESYTSFLYSIPLTLNFELEGWIDNYDTAFKIEQKIYETFYKNQTFRVLYRGLSISCCAGFPETITTGEKVVSYSFEQENQLKMNFNIAVECYYPSFDESESIPSGNVIENIGFDVSELPSKGEVPQRIVDLKLGKLNPVYSVGSEMVIGWSSKSNVSEVCTVILYYVTKDGDKHIIDIPDIRNASYYWTIPEYLSPIKQPIVAFIPDTDLIGMQKEPVVKVRPGSDGIVSDGCFSIEDPGKFSHAGYVQVSCESMDGGAYKISDGYIGKVNSEGELEEIFLYSNVEETIPEEYRINPMTTEPFSYDVESSSTPITVGISYPLDKRFFDEIHNILII